MLKCEYLACGYTVRTARKWLETAGAPLCPVPGHGAMCHEPLDGEGRREFVPPEKSPINTHKWRGVP
jgi:hypothetical protein